MKQKLGRLWGFYCQFTRDRILHHPRISFWVFLTLKINAFLQQINCSIYNAVMRVRIL